MFTNKLLPCISVLLLSALLSSCSGLTRGYSGPTRADSETAILLPQGCSLRTVNGIDVGNTSSGARVLEGQNEIELTVDESNFNSRGRDENRYKLRLDAKAGISYAITGRRGDGRLCAFPLDPGTGQPDLLSPAGCIARN